MRLIVRLSICDVLCLLVLLTEASALAIPPAVTFKELVARREFDESEGRMMQHHLSYHVRPVFGLRRHLVVVSWFYKDPRIVLRYTVTDKGESENVRFVYSHASQAAHEEQFSSEKLSQLHKTLDKLPVSKSEPFIEKTVHVSFQSRGEWRTETYDSDSLPPEFEAVMRLLGERFETLPRQKKR